MKTLSELRSVHRIGRVEWIGVRPAWRAAMLPVGHAEAIPGVGLVGDHVSQRPGGARQITLVQAEHLAVVAALCELPSVAPGALRRNLVVSGINLLALRHARFLVGEVMLEGRGSCAPCSRMEEALGPGGYNAMRGHGGLTARVLRGGRLHCGDPVRFLQTSEE